MSGSLIQFYEVFAEEEEALRRHLPPDWSCTFSPLTIQEHGDQIPPAPIVCIRTQSVIPPAWQDRLEGLLSRSAGYDHLIRFSNAVKRSVPSGHLSKYSGRAVAEHAAMMWLALLRKLPRQIKAMRSFHRDGLTGRECEGATLSVFGVGDIGYQICRIGTGLGMRTLGVDLDPARHDISYVTRDDAIAQADVIACAMNLNDTNVEYFSREILTSCRPGTVFVNVARGEFARSSLLLELLDAGVLGGVGLDVFYDEPTVGPALREGTDPGHPELKAMKDLMNRSDAILTPHNAFNSAEAVDRKSRQTVDQLKYFFDHGTFMDAIG